MTQEAFAQAARTYGDTVYRIAYHALNSRADAEDVTQTVLLKLYECKKNFESEEHIKAWLIRVVINRAKDIRSSFWRRNQTSYEDYMAELPFEEPEDSRLFEAVMQLEEKYRIVVHMFYYEDYDIKEIAHILKCPSGTVKSRLSRARALLKTTLKEDWNDD